MWSSVIELFRNYMGTGLIMVWFLVCLVYLFFMEKDKGKRVLFLYVPAILFLLFFNPLFMRVVYGFIGTEIYYRILWLIPVTIVIAYTIVILVCRLKGRQAAGFLMLAVLLIMLSGSNIYKNQAFCKAENANHMPTAVVNICDMIEVEGREVMAVFPQELLSFVRQYSPLICMPYGRDVLIERWNIINGFYEAMEEPVLDAEKIAGYAKQHSCHYIIVRAEQEVQGRFEDYDYAVVGETDGYVVYQDITAYRGY